MLLHLGMSAKKLCTFSSLPILCCFSVKGNLSDTLGVSYSSRRMLWNVVGAEIKRCDGAVIRVVEV